jgi:hypothetical protein
VNFLVDNVIIFKRHMERKMVTVRHMFKGVTNSMEWSPS